MGQCARTASDIEANIYLSYLASLQTYVCSAGTLDTQSQMGRLVQRIKPTTTKGGGYICIGLVKPKYAPAFLQAGTLLEFPARLE